jgi:hypothetical protein
MTEPSGPAPPPVVVDHDDQWIEIDLTGDLTRWARRTASDIVARARAAGQARRRDERGLAAMLAGAGRIARRPGDAAIALLLFPTLADGMIALVRFCLVDLAGREGDEAWDDLVSSIIPGGDAGPPEVTGLQTTAGPCRRIRQLFTAGDGDQPPGEHLGYAWAFPQYGMAVVAVTSFTDLTAASRWRPALDALARAVALDPAARAGGR